MDAISIQGWWLGGLSYALCHLLHIILWRRRPIQHDVRTLLLLLFVIPLPLLAWISPKCGASPFAALVTHFALSANYLAIYPAFQACSPTIEILYQLQKSPTGKTGEELSQAIGGQSLIENRLEDLRHSRLIETRGGTTQLTRAGYWLATFFVGYRRFLGLPTGEG